jgi:hypothetical protein
VAEILDQAGVVEAIDDAKLGVSELATNAVLHARSDFVVSVIITAKISASQSTTIHPNCRREQRRERKRAGVEDWRSSPDWPPGGVQS